MKIQKTKIKSLTIPYYVGVPIVVSHQYENNFDTLVPRLSKNEIYMAINNYIIATNKYKKK